MIQVVDRTCKFTGLEHSLINININIFKVEQPLTGWSLDLNRLAQLKPVLYRACPDTAALVAGGLGAWPQQLSLTN